MKCTVSLDEGDSWVRCSRCGQVAKRSRDGAVTGVVPTKPVSPGAISFRTESIPPTDCDTHLAGKVLES